MTVLCIWNTNMRHSERRSSEETKGSTRCKCRSRANPHLHYDPLSGSTVAAVSKWLRNESTNHKQFMYSFVFEIATHIVWPKKNATRQPAAVKNSNKGVSLAFMCIKLSRRLYLSRFRPSFWDDTNSNCNSSRPTAMVTERAPSCCDLPSGPRGINQPHRMEGDCYTLNEANTKWP